MKVSAVFVLSELLSGFPYALGSFPCRAMAEFGQYDM